MCASHGCGTMWPSGPTASRATRIHARSTTLALRASRPVRGQASAWSPSKSTGPPQPGDGPQRPEAIGRGKRSRRRRDSGKPGACVRPGLGAKQGPVVGRQGWQQHPVAIVEVASPRRVELPAVRPVSEACFCMWRRQKAARDVVPLGAVSPTFGDQKPSGCVRMGKAPGVVVAQMALQLRRHVRESGLDDRQGVRPRGPVCRRGQAHDAAMWATLLELIRHHGGRPPGPSCCFVASRLRGTGSAVCVKAGHRGLCRAVGPSEARGSREGTRTALTGATRTVGPAGAANAPTTPALGPFAARSMRL